MKKPWKLDEDGKVVKAKPSKKMTHDEWVEYNIAYQNNRRERQKKKK